MTDRPQRRHFIKWVPKAWRGDLALHSCSLAARGLWAELLMVMHECEPYGHLAFDGRAPDIAAIARLAGTSTSEAKRLLAELEAANVFSRTSEGVIYSRRFVEDERAYIAACANGSRGGNPALKRAEPLDGGITPPVAESDNGPLRARAGAHSRVRVSESSEEHAARVPHARTREAAPPESESEPAPPALTDTARAELVRHPTLCTTAVSAALVRWESWARGRGKLPKWTSDRWAAGFAEWATWGPDRLVRAIDRSIVVGSDTVLEPFAGSAAQPSKPAPDPAVVRSQAERAARERDVERRWESLHTTEREMPGIDGAPVKRLVLDAKYPGHEAAERELRAAGLLNGHASAMPATPVGVRT